MDILGIVTLFGGLALFLYGMKEMSDSLMLVSGSRLKVMLERMTSNPIKAVFLGAGVTAVIQASAATTVMVVGLVNAGLLPLSQTVGLIMGANIGTTVTAWILSLGTLGTQNAYLQVLNPSFFVPLIAIVSVAFMMFVKDERKRNVSRILVGFAILMFGMQTMSGAMIPLSAHPAFAQLFIRFTNPILGMLVGALLTAIIQSSSASIGILQAFTLTGAVTYGAAIPIIMGQNIGTCVTALTSSINTTKNAKRAALIHLFFNVLGTVVFMSGFYLINLIRPFSFLNQTPTAIDIAIVNTVYKVSATALFLPFRDGLVRFVTWLTPVKEGEQFDLLEEVSVFAALDERFLETPGFAVSQSRQLTNQMAELVLKQYRISAGLLDVYDGQKHRDSKQMEDLVDQFEDRLGTYMVQISARQLTDREKRILTQLMQSLSDFERISDHALSIAISAKEMSDKQICFSDAAISELAIYKQAVGQLLDTTVEAFIKEDLELATHVEPLEEVVDELTDELQARHVQRLQDGRCTLELGFVLMDVLTSMERIADHCSNIAVSMIELSHDSLDQHAFLQGFRKEHLFTVMYDQFKADYSLPALPVSDYAEQLSLDETMTGEVLAD
ncbi:MAG TPA: Na/Pi cotransporter family protein [Clostridia bacterium]|nr:Na/Pi cotransporter family protein [Clostridia bacterium]